MANKVLKKIDFKVDLDQHVLYTDGNPIRIPEQALSKNGLPLYRPDKLPELTVKQLTIRDTIVLISEEVNKKNIGKLMLLAQLSPKLYTDNKVLHIENQKELALIQELIMTSEQMLCVPKANVMNIFEIDPADFDHLAEDDDQALEDNYKEFPEEEFITINLTEAINFHTGQALRVAKIKYDENNNPLWKQIVKFDENGNISGTDIEYEIDRVSMSVRDVFQVIVASMKSKSPYKIQTLSTILPQITDKSNEFIISNTKQLKLLQELTVKCSDIGAVPKGKIALLLNIDPSMFPEEIEETEEEKPVDVK